jgi:hypothetical protein
MGNHRTSAYGHPAGIHYSKTLGRGFKIKTVLLPKRKAIILMATQTWSKRGNRQQPCGRGRFWRLAALPVGYKNTKTGSRSIILILKTRPSLLTIISIIST